MHACMHDAAAELVFVAHAQSLRKLRQDVTARGLPQRAQYVWLLGCSTNVSDAQLDAFAMYGTGIGPEKVNLSAFLIALMLCTTDGSSQGLSRAWT